MMEMIFKRKRKVSGKTITAKTYTGRYKLAGDPDYTTVPLGVSDKQVAQQKLRNIVQREERARAGIGVSKAESDCMNASLSELLAVYVGELERLGRASEYTRHVSARVEALIKACGWIRLRDVTADSFRSWRNGKVASVKTINEYQNAIAGLLNWVGKSRSVKLPVFDSLEHIDARGRQSFERRALTVDEARKLLAVSPFKRRVGYAIALYTGLRRGEIEALEWRDLSLDSDSPCVSVRASISKNRKQATISLHPDLVEILRQWRDSLPSKSGLVVPDGVPKTVHGLWKDLESAGIARTDPDGRKVDFHSLRHTTCTLLQAAGVSSRVAMEIMRHSDMRLTAKIYTDAGGLPTAAGIIKMPSLIDAKKWTLDLTQTVGFRGQGVSQTDIPGKTKPDAQPVGVQSVVTDCHGLSSSGKSREMVEAGGVEPPSEKVFP